jgi:hypothetical protein
MAMVVVAIFPPVQGGNLMIGEVSLRGDELLRKFDDWSHF